MEPPHGKRFTLLQAKDCQDGGGRGKSKSKSKAALDIFYLKEILQRGEVTRREKNFNLSVEAYTQVATYFQNTIGDLQSAKHFFSRCIEISMESGDTGDLLATSNLNVGM